jgi:hypothetical protein
MFSNIYSLVTKQVQFQRGSHFDHVAFKIIRSVTYSWKYVPNLNFQDATPVNFNWICKCNQFRVYWVGMGIKHEKKNKKKNKKKSSYA